jgi:hypothetical protein
MSPQRVKGLSLKCKGKLPGVLTKGNVQLDCIFTIIFSEPDCSQGKGKMRHWELRFQRGEAKKVLGKFDELHDYIPNSGLHYKINENFGRTVITVGRNFHRYSDVYKNLRAAPAPLEYQISLSLNLVISELESARHEAAFLKEESQLKVTVLEGELDHKTKIMILWGAVDTWEWVFISLDFRHLPISVITNIFLKLI